MIKKRGKGTKGVKKRVEKGDERLVVLGRSFYVEESRLIYNGRRCGGIRHQYHTDTRPRGQLSWWTKATGVYAAIPHVSRYAARAGLRLFTQLTRLVLGIAWARSVRAWANTRTSWRTQLRRKLERSSNAARGGARTSRYLSAIESWTRDRLETKHTRRARHLLLQPFHRVPSFFKSAEWPNRGWRMDR